MTRNFLTTLLSIFMLYLLAETLDMNVGFSAADTTKPTTPKNLVTKAITSKSVTFSWTASTDNVGVTGYQINSSGKAIGTVSTTSVIVSGLLANTSYSFTVQAMDAAKNLSVASAALNVKTLPPDTQAPTAPKNLTGTVPSSTSVTLSWTAATDNVGVTGYNVYIGSSSIGTVTSVSAIVNGLSANTSYSFSVKAKDDAGNISSASNVLVLKTLAAANPYPIGDTVVPLAKGTPYNPNLNLAGVGPMTEQQIYSAIKDAIFNTKYSNILVGDDMNKAFKIGHYVVDAHPEMFSGYSDADAAANTSFMGYSGGYLSFPTMTTSEIKKVTDALTFAYNLTKTLNLLNISDPKKKAQVINDWIVANAEYNTASFNSKTVSRDDRSAYGIFFKKTAVCTGYTAAFNAIANWGGGMFSYGIAGHAWKQNGTVGGHAWNQFVADTTVTTTSATPPTMLQIDTTWNDGTKTNYFTNLTPLQMSQPDMNKEMHGWDPDAVDWSWYRL